MKSILTSLIMIVSAVFMALSLREVDSIWLFYAIIILACILFGYGAANLFYDGRGRMRY